MVTHTVETWKKDMNLLSTEMETQIVNMFMKNIHFISNVISENYN